MGLEARSGRWARHGEPLLVLVGIYAVQFLITRVAVNTVPGLAVVQPIDGLAAWLFTSWDAEIYLRLAQDFDCYAWPPLFPMLLRAIASLGVTVHVAAVLVNLLAHAAIVWLAYAFLRGNARLHEVPGWLFASLILFFPGHNVFFAAYSESLFLALLLGACVAYQRERLWLAGLLCGFAVLTRNMGAFLGAALIVVEVAKMVRERRFDGHRLAAVALWVPFLIGWEIWLAEVAHTDSVAATLYWQTDLLENHVPAGDNPKLWVLRFIALPGRAEHVFFWGLVVAGAYSWRERMQVESVLIGVFLLSFAFYLYRPFPFSRYASVLFPLPLMVAHATRRWPALQALALGVAVAISHHYEVMLFSGRFGEP